jgi:hypothetical protein
MIPPNARVESVIRAPASPGSITLKLQGRWIDEKSAQCHLMLRGKQPVSAESVHVTAIGTSGAVEITARFRMSPLHAGAPWSLVVRDAYGEDTLPLDGGPRVPPPRLPVSGSRRNQSSASAKELRSLSKTRTGRSKATRTPPEKEGGPSKGKATKSKSTKSRSKGRR